MLDNGSIIPEHHANALVDPAAYADGRVYETYAWLRANLPFGQARVEGYDPFWVATRYDDVRAISRDNKRFPYGDKSVTLTDQRSDAFIRQLTGGKPYIQRSIVQMDPPDHMKYRLLAQNWFMPKNVKAIGETVDQLACNAVRLMAGNTKCDFVKDVALLYPLRVIMHILGVPDEDLPMMLRLTQEIFAPRDPESVPDGLDMSDPEFMGQALRSVIVEFGQFFQKIAADRRVSPRSDLISVIANATIDGKPISQEEELGYYTIVATAGHDTTSSSLAAALYGLATTQGLLARIKADMELIPNLVEESIRWATPVKTFMRAAAEDTEYAGQRVNTNDWIMLCYGSANRDEVKFPDGAEFNIDRPFMEHLSFGYGPHVCLGQHLARLEINMLLRHLIPRLASVRLDGEAKFSHSFFANGLKKMPIEYELV